MASYILRTYLANRYNILGVERLRDLLRESTEICTRRSIPASVSGMPDSIILQYYTYNEEADVLLIKCCPDQPGELDSITTDTLFTLLDTMVIQSILVSTTRQFPYYIESNAKEIINWSKMITDLHLAEKIVVSETKSVMAVDKRRFYFVGEPSASSVDVDFLGTKMCQEEGEKVIEEWRKIA